MEDQRFEVSDERERAIAQQIRARLDHIEVAREAYAAARARVPAPWSQLATDDAALGWLQLSHQVQAFLGLAGDNLRAVRDMVSVDGGLVLPMYAHYSVLRSALEASALAKWILSPTDQRERLTRSLRARMDDTKRDRELHEETMKAAALHGRVDIDLLRRADAARSTQAKAVRLQIRNVSDQQSLMWGTVTSGLPGMVTVLRSVGGADEIPGEFVASTWKMMSGLAHPSASRLTNHSTIEVLSESEAGIINARLTASMTSTHQALLVAVSMFFDAVQLLTHRIVSTSARRN